MAWYQRIYFNLKGGFKHISFNTIISAIVISVIIYFIITYYKPAQCFKYTTPYIIGDNFIKLYSFYPPSLNYVVPNKGDLSQIIKNAELLSHSNQLKYDIIWYKPINNLIVIDKNSPLNHPHILLLNLDAQNFLVSAQLTSNPITGFSYLADKCIVGNKGPQLISNNFYFFDKN
jgi:hypothetical protein